MNNAIVSIENREVISAPNDVLGAVQGPTISSIENVNVSHSSKVYIGPEFVSVTQNVNKVDIIRGRLTCVLLKNIIFYM